MRATMSEADFQTRVIDTAHRYGWLAHHARAAWTSKGWRTPVQGDKGAPDLLLARAGVLIVAELKTDRGRLAPEQRAWGDAIGAQWRCWRPRDWDRVLAELKGAA